LRAFVRAEDDRGWYAALGGSGDGFMLVELDIPLSEVRPGPIHLLNRYWEDKRNGRALPRWLDFDPADLKPILPFMFVVGIENQPFRVHYRLVGTVASELRGPLTGRYLDQIEVLPPDVRTRLIEEYRLACQRRRPTFSRDVLCLRSERELTFFGSIYPLSTDGITVDRCVCVEDYGDLIGLRGYGGQSKGGYRIPEGHGGGGLLERSLPLASQ